MTLSFVCAIFLSINMCILPTYLFSGTFFTLIYFKKQRNFYPTFTPIMSSDSGLEYHLSLLKLHNTTDQIEVASASPVFTGSVLNLSTEGPSQYGLLGGVKGITTLGLPSLDEKVLEVDPRLFFNVASPSSTFICGSQGSGKSHTLSCLLEGCLISSRAGKLMNPLTAIIFHYDTFISDTTGSPCEAAFLSSNPSIEVRVLCSSTNLRTIKVMQIVAHVAQLTDNPCFREPTPDFKVSQFSLYKLTSQILIPSV
jgi:hypothetical protein